MPTPIKLFDLVSIPGTRHLWPKEFDGLVKTWEEAKSNDQLGIIADWLDDNDEPELAHAFRWCYKRNIPFAGSDCRIENKHLPLCLHKVHPMARKKIKTAQSIFEQLKVDMQGLTFEERVKLVELVLADPDFGNGQDFAESSNHDRDSELERDAIKRELLYKLFLTASELKRHIEYCFMKKSSSKEVEQ